MRGLYIPCNGDRFFDEIALPENLSLVGSRSKPNPARKPCCLEDVKHGGMHISRQGHFHLWAWMAHGARLGENRNDKHALPGSYSQSREKRKRCLIWWRKDGNDIDSGARPERSIYSMTNGGHTLKTERCLWVREEDPVIFPEQEKFRESFSFLLVRNCILLFLPGIFLDTWHGREIIFFERIRKIFLFGRKRGVIFSVSITHSFFP